ncbi:hypothetical protein L917_17291, partial [Phytophthora nicotianae]
VSQSNRLLFLFSRKKAQALLQVAFCVMERSRRKCEEYSTRSWVENMTTKEYARYCEEKKRREEQSGSHRSTTANNLKPSALATRNEQCAAACFPRCFLHYRHWDAKPVALCVR